MTEYLLQVIQIVITRHSHRCFDGQSNNYSLQKHTRAIYRNFGLYKSKISLEFLFDIFLIFAQNIDCGYTLEPPRQFVAKIRKIAIPL